MSLLLVSPRMAASAGHDKVIELAARALEVGPDERLALARPGASFAARASWGALELGKAVLARLDDLRPGYAAVRAEPRAELSPGALTRLLETASQRARRSGELSRVLTAAYRRELEERAASGERSRVVSSHYLALAGRPSDWPGTLLGPDLLAQSAAGAISAPRVALAPSASYADGLLQAGFHHREVLVSGPLVDASLYSARKRRWARRARVAAGEALPACLLTVGGSAPERGAVVEVARALVRRGVRVRALVGDGRPHACALRRKLEELGLGIEVLGGRPGVTRDEELAHFHACLGDPDSTTWITRPNEGAPLALALGFELLLLPPYQPHERAAGALLAERGVPEALGLLEGASLGRAPDERLAELVPLRSPETWATDPDLVAALGEALD